jgi:AraC family transcriptional regulator
MLECQIHAAKTHLLSRTKDLADIAKDCGFAHQSHFTSRFKQATGLTPTRWRRMMLDRERAMAS